MRLSGEVGRGYRRRLRLGLPTVLGMARHGFFIPYRYAGDIDDGETYPALVPLFLDAEAAFAEMLATIDRYREALVAIGGAPPPQPRWQQTWFPRLDAAAAYALVRHCCPRRIVEVGSGHSTRFLARAIADGGLSTALTAIDPAPRADLTGLPVHLLRQPVQQVDPAIFSPLRAGDMLVIDSSHVLMPGTDVDLLLNRVLPSLPPGVLVHVHDVFLPDGYPRAWRWRGYNEQLAVAALIQGGGWRLVWSSHHVITRMTARLRGHVASELDCPADAVESSLWLEKLVPAQGCVVGAGCATASAGTKNR